MYYRAVCTNQHGLDEGEEKGEFWVRRRLQQEAEHLDSPTASTTPKRVPSREAPGGHLHDKHGKEAPGATPPKQEQPC